MAQFIYVQDESAMNSVITGNADQGTRNVFLYHPTTTSSPGTFQQATPPSPMHQQQTQQWVQNIAYNSQGQMVYTTPQQNATVVQSPMNVIVQSPNQQNRTNYMKMIAVSQQATQQHQQQQHVVSTMPPRTLVSATQSGPVRTQLMPVILNSGYRPNSPQQQQILQSQSTPVNQSVIINTGTQIRSGPQQQQQQHQQVIIDPRMFNVIQSTNTATGGQPQQQQQQAPRTVQYRLVPATKPQPQQSQAAAPRQVIINRAPQPRIIRPPVRLTRPPNGIIGPTGHAPRIMKQPTSTAALRPIATRLQLQQHIRPRAANSTQIPRLIASGGAIRQAAVPQQQQQLQPQQQKLVIPGGSVLKGPIMRPPFSSNSSTGGQVVRQLPQPQPPRIRSPQQAPMVEVRPPSCSSTPGMAHTDDDIENSLSTAILRRGPQQQQQPQLEVEQSQETSIGISAAMHTDVINTQSSCETAKMLVVLPDEERRLITFTLPTESCTVTELLDQVGIQLTPNMQVRCVAIADEDLDYVVTITEMKAPQVIVQTMTPIQVQVQQSPQSQPQPPPPLTPVMRTPAGVRGGIVGGHHVQQQQQQQPQQEAQTQVAVTTPHIPTYIDGFMAICDFCGFFSMDHGKCERCNRTLLKPQIKPTKAAAAVPATATVTTTATIITPTVQKKIIFTAPAKTAAVRGGRVLANNLRKGMVVKTPSPNSRGRGALAGRGRGTRMKKVEEPVVLTLSSDEEEEEEGETGDKKQQKATVPFAFEPVFGLPEAGDGPHVGDSEISDADRVDVTSQLGTEGSENTSVEAKELRIGSYAVPQPNRHLVIITHLGIKIVAPSCADPSQTVKLNIQLKEILKFVVHYAKTMPVIFLYTTPSCGRYIRKALGMQNALAQQQQPFFDPASNQELVKRIVIVAKQFRDDTKATIKSVFPLGYYDEIPYRDAVELLQRSRPADREDATTATRAGSTRKSAVNANVAIKQAVAAITESETKATTLGESACPADAAAAAHQIHKLLIYPQGKGGISINTEDYRCLAVDQYLNDVIIDFYLKYLHEQVMTPEQRNRTHIFSSFFYKRLTATSARQRQIERDLKMTPAQKRHHRVRSWTKNVNLFEKDFIVIPINELSHWFLAIICFPGLDKPRSMVTGQEMPVRVVGKATSQLTLKAVREVARKSTGLMSLTIGNTTITPVSRGREENIYVNEETLSERDEAEGEDSDMDDDADEESEEAEPVRASQRDPMKQPCILVFDSLRGTYRSRVTATLREYLSCEYAAKKPDGAEEEKVFDRHLMPGHNAMVPQQNNFTDCGLFVLQYVEEMCRSPISDFKLPMKLLKNWFGVQKVTRKREDIALLIRTMLQQEHPERVALLPEIDFPTVNGVPVETTTTVANCTTGELGTAETNQNQAPVNRDTEEDEDAHSEDLFAEIENTVVEEQEEEEDDAEEESNLNASSSSSRGKKVTKLLIPKKRKSSLNPSSPAGGGSAKRAK